MTSNGNHSPRHLPLQPGVYAPILTMFTAHEDLDLPTQKAHALRLARAGLVGLVVLGSNGEAVHLTRAERSQVITTIRTGLDDAGFQELPLIVGCSEQSTRQTVELTQEAARDGASYAIVLPPSYYKPAMTPEVLYRFFTEVADASPIPVLMYNYPGAVAGIDMDSDLMIRIARHPNVKGCKLTCYSTGKLTRIAAATDAISLKGQGSGFLATGGFADIVVQCMVSGGSGVIAGTGNVVPKLCVRVWKLCEQGKLQEAMELQRLLASVDWELSKRGIAGTKAALQECCGYGITPRRPLGVCGEAACKEVRQAIAEGWKLENGL